MTTFKNDPRYRDFRTHLRKNLTPSEARLWKVLRRANLDGRKFRRQYGIGRYVLDFYCPSEKLAIELDGDGHFSVADVHYDNERRRFAEQFGIRIIRFDNKMLLRDAEYVIETIRSHFRETEAPPPG